MNLTGIAILNGYSILLLAVLLFYSLGGAYGRSRQRGLYVALLTTTMALMALDILSRFDGFLTPAFPSINWWGNLLLFLFTPLLPTFWVEYVYLQISGDKKIPLRVHIALLLLNAANCFMVIATQFTGWYYAIDAANVYHRGPLFPFSHLITVGMVAWAYGVTFRNRREIDKRVFYSLTFYPIPSFLGITLQMLFYGYPFALLAEVPSLLVVLLYAQDDSIFTDYLTGVGNRKKLETVLKEKIARSSPNRTFAFIMLDIDHFKKINDSLGHEAGDRMLKATAALMKKCVRANDYVTRYGGDEFCLILDVVNDAGLQRVVSRIQCALQALNQSGSLPYPLSFSMGHAVYDFGEHLAPEDFFKRMDMLMYEDKRKKSAGDGQRAGNPSA